MNMPSGPFLNKARFLFVDDEPAILNAIERYLRPVRQVWDCEFVSNSLVALNRIRATGFHVLVADMVMPGMNGAELLAKTRDESPDTIRVMLTGNADMQTALAAVNQGHVFQFLVKPCGGEQLFQSLAIAARQYQLREAERELLRTQLEHTEKMTVIGQLAAGINHDLNNIMTAIMMQTEMALADTSSKSLPRPALEQIRQATLRAAQMTRELNSFSRADKGSHWGTLDLRAVVESCLCIVRPLLTKNVSLLTELPSGLPQLRGDAGKLKQAIMNLVLNARDAMPEGGEIKLTVQEVDLPAAAGSSAPRRHSGPHVCLIVSDSGCGMDAATQAKLFKPFFTTKAAGKGTGLGLFMVGQILEQHSGWVEVDSAPGRGTKFKIYFPTAKPTAERSGA